MQNIVNVGFLVTCLADLLRPSIGFAAVELLEDANCGVHVPEQTCCGQPAYNSGDRRTTMEIARQVIQSFEAFDYVVVPSGSCAGMLTKHYPDLFGDDPVWAVRARKLAIKTFELTAFLVDVLDFKGIDTHLNCKVTYHDACAGLRELNLKRQPRHLLKMVGGLQLVELDETETCCGFGGTFCVKYPDISVDIVEQKANDVIDTGADLLLAGDLGCLLNIAGRLKRKGSSVQVRHIAEVLAGTFDKGPPIGGARED